jgi:hypothetical protein
MYGQVRGEAADLFADHARIETDLEHVGAGPKSRGYQLAGLVSPFSGMGFGN